MAVLPLDGGQYDVCDLSEHDRGDTRAEVDGYELEGIMLRYKVCLVLVCSFLIKLRIAIIFVKSWKDRCMSKEGRKSSNPGDEYDAQTVTSFNFLYSTQKRSAHFSSWVKLLKQSLLFELVSLLFSEHALDSLFCEVHCFASCTIQCWVDWALFKRFQLDAVFGYAISSQVSAANCFILFWHSERLSHYCVYYSVFFMSFLQLRLAASSSMVFTCLQLSIFGSLNSFLL